jgi:hypothetical protein
MRVCLLGFTKKILSPRLPEPDHVRKATFGKITVLASRERSLCTSVVGGGYGILMTNVGSVYYQTGPARITASENGAAEQTGLIEAVRPLRISHRVFAHPTLPHRVLKRRARFDARRKRPRPIADASPLAACVFPEGYNQKNGNSRQISPPSSLLEFFVVYHSSTSQAHRYYATDESRNRGPWNFKLEPLPSGSASESKPATAEQAKPKSDGRDKRNDKTTNKHTETNTSVRFTVQALHGGNQLLKFLPHHRIQPAAAVRGLLPT